MNDELEPRKSDVPSAREKRMAKYKDWSESDAPIVTETTPIPIGSSQKGTQIPKKGASPLHALRFVAWMGAIAGAGVAAGSSALPLWAQFICVATTGAAGGFLLAQIEREEQRADRMTKINWDLFNEFEDFKESLPAGEFLHGMTQSGVEVILAGGDFYGPSAKVKVRYPESVLHRHLVDAMMHGYSEAMKQAKKQRTREELQEQRFKYEVLASKWIFEMAKGGR